MNKKLEKFLIQIIKEEIKLGSRSSYYHKNKAQMFLDELRASDNENLELVYNDQHYSAWDLLLCVKYDVI